MKEEIANEFGVQLGADTTARANGSVGGEMTIKILMSREAQDFPELLFFVLM
jgi:small acid-soluble spore protein A (major alpha-type SASP)